MEAANNAYKKVIFKNYVPFTDWIREIIKTQVDNNQDIDIIMLMYIVIEYNENYLEASRSLWQYYKDDPWWSLTDAGTIVDFGGNNTSNAFDFKEQIISPTGEDDTKYAEIMVPLKYLNNF